MVKWHFKTIFYTHLFVFSYQIQKLALNERIDLALQFVLHTNHTVFLTGKAGTGKTTFLHQIKQLSVKRFVVVAPTGIAAINAGGVTIHSLFQLPFGPLVPGTILRHDKKFAKEKISLLRTLDLLIIDEISMVRADVLDGIDEVFRQYRNSKEPFGGVQLLLIGDMQQLPPIISDKEWVLLNPYYETGYFFSSKALGKISYVSIELIHVYRQTDEHFINLLNAIRDKTLTQMQLADLNKRYIPEFTPPSEEGYITLSTHNATAQQINTERLANLHTTLRAVEATIEGDFPVNVYPTEAILELKVGAQVIFIKNDHSLEKLYYNGKIGQITGIDNGVIYVQSWQDQKIIAVLPAEWSNIRYGLDPVTKEIKADTIGSFRQYPLKLAWAISIHKSQGLTFDKAIIEASAAFAHGQVYVALSRCKTLEGLVLRSPIPSHSIKTELTIDGFQSNLIRQTATVRQLQEAKRITQQQLIQELFSFEQASSLLNHCRQIINEHGKSLAPQYTLTITMLTDSLHNKVCEISYRFQRQLLSYFTNEQLAEDNLALQERVRKGSLYFLEILTNELLSQLYSFYADNDTSQVSESIWEAIEEFEKELYIKLCLFKHCQNGFLVLDYLRHRNHAELDFQSKRKHIDLQLSIDINNSNQSGLYEALMKWRNDLGDEYYMVISQKLIAELAQLQPTTLDELLTIRGFGKTKVKQIGNEILSIINEYLKDHP